MADSCCCIVLQKPTQHCKAIILQLKFFKKLKKRTKWGKKHQLQTIVLFIQKKRSFLSTRDFPCFQAILCEVDGRRQEEEGFSLDSLPPVGLPQHSTHGGQTYQSLICSLETLGIIPHALRAKTPV